MRPTESQGSRRDTTPDSATVVPLFDPADLTIGMMVKVRAKHPELSMTALLTERKGHFSLWVVRRASETDANAVGRRTTVIPYDAILDARCEGCEGWATDVGPLTPGRVVANAPEPRESFTVVYCAGCWEAVDGQDPISHSWGAACIPVSREPLPGTFAGGACYFCWCDDAEGHPVRAYYIDRDREPRQIQPACPTCRDRINNGEAHGVHRATLVNLDEPMGLAVA